MPVLVDSSARIEYFRSGNNSEKLDFLIDKNLIVINDLILAELIPSLKVRHQREVINLLYIRSKSWTYPFTGIKLLSSNSTV